jgi:GNAT superfamily N-acetyltransferase
MPDARAPIDDDHKSAEPYQALLFWRARRASDAQPAHRRAGAGKAILEQLMAAADRAGYTCIRLDS